MNLIRKRIAWLMAAISITVLMNPASATSLPEVHMIGTAYAGKYSTILQRFPYVAKLDEFGSASNRVDVITRRVMALFDNAKFQHYKLTTDQISNQNESDQVLDLTLLIDKENVLQTSYNINGEMIYKVFAQVRAQALYFDVAQSAIVRSMPLSYAQISTFSHPPSQMEVAHCVKLALYGTDGKSGVVGRFVNFVASASLPASGAKFFRVKKIVIGSKAANALAIDVDNERVQIQDLQNSIADTFTEIFSASQGIFFIPYASDYLVGNRIPLSLSNGDAFSLKLPSADYDVALQFLGAKRILYGQSAAGRSLIYGTLFKIEIMEPISGRMYLDADFKNGVVAKVPVTQTDDKQDDRFGYADSVRSLFDRLSRAVDADGTNWSARATSAADIDSQLKNTKELFQSCK